MGLLAFGAIGMDVDMDVRAALVGDPAPFGVGEADLGNLPGHDHLRSQLGEGVPELQSHLEV